MSVLKWNSASIFWLRFGVEADWQLDINSVRSPIMPDSKLFARGVWDAAVDFSNGLFTIPAEGLTITLTVTPTEPTPPLVFNAVQLTVDMDMFTVDSNLFTVDQTVATLPA